MFPATNADVVAGAALAASPVAAAAIVGSTAWAYGMAADQVAAAFD